MQDCSFEFHAIALVLSSLTLLMAIMQQPILVPLKYLPPKSQLLNLTKMFSLGVQPPFMPLFHVFQHPPTYGETLSWFHCPMRESQQASWQEPIWSCSLMLTGMKKSYIHQAKRLSPPRLARSRALASKLISELLGFN